MIWRRVDAAVGGWSVDSLSERDDDFIQDWLTQQEKFQRPATNKELMETKQKKHYRAVYEHA